jgi:class 3 adenylate cyclase
MARERTATVWISDMSGFTLLTHLNGPRAVMDMVFAMREVVSEVIRARRGHVFKCVADNIYALFETPLDALRAAEDARSRLAEETRVCIGIGHGPLMLFPGEEDYFGMEINLASKLGEDTACPGEVLLTEAAYRGLPEPFRPCLDGPHVLPVDRFQFHYYRLRGPVAEGRPTVILPPGEEPAP